MSNHPSPTLRIGTAGWTIPRAVAQHFPAEGAGLVRYAARFSAVEINSTFYRPHRPTTFARWAEITPAGFRFAVKAPRAVTHEAKLAGASGRMAQFLDELAPLGAKLGPLLVQLPPSLAFDAAVARAFFADLRARFEGAVVCEPRHASWFEPEADALMRGLHVARAAADPAKHRQAAAPGGWPGLAYWRWHGSPHMYRSAYGEERLRELAQGVAHSRAVETWVIFDNTTLGAAAADALALGDLLDPGRRSA